jgi:hypothetical protein
MTDHAAIADLARDLTPTGVVIMAVGMLLVACALMFVAMVTDAEDDPHDAE